MPQDRAGMVGVGEEGEVEEVWKQSPQPIVLPPRAGIASASACLLKGSKAVRIKVTPGGTAELELSTAKRCLYSLVPDASPIQLVSNFC